jgi:hypothetical protein
MPRFNQKSTPPRLRTWPDQKESWCRSPATELLVVHLQAGRKYGLVALQRSTLSKHRSW